MAARTGKEISLLSRSTNVCMASANFMRLSLLKGAHAALSSATWQELEGPEVIRTCSVRW
jgi:hypothetical protein